MAWPLRGERRGVKAWPLRTKNFFEAREKKSKKNVATDLEALVAEPLKKNFFCGFPKSNYLRVANASWTRITLKQVLWVNICISLSMNYSVCKQVCMPVSLYVTLFFWRDYLSWPAVAEDSWRQIALTHNNGSALRILLAGTNSNFWK